MIYYTKRKGVEYYANLDALTVQRVEYRKDHVRWLEGRYEFSNEIDYFTALLLIANATFWNRVR